MPRCYPLHVIRAFTALLLISLCLPTGISFGAATPTPSFQKVLPDVPSWYNAPLVIKLEPDQKLCKEQYKDAWEDRCSRAPGIAEEPGRDITLTPELAGEWWWDSGWRLSFKPEQGWPDDQEFTVSFGPKTFRPGTTLSSSEVKFTTPPNAATVEKPELWIDPSPRGEHGLSFFVRFLYPQPETADAAFDIAVAGTEKDEPGTSGLGLGEARIAWNQSRTQATVSIPLARLSDTDSVVALTLKGYPFKNAKNGTISREQEPQGRRYVPARKGLLVLGRPEIVVETNDALKQEFHLKLEANSLLPPEDLLNHMKIVQMPLKRTPNTLEPFNWREAPAIEEEEIAAGTPVSIELVTPADEPAARLYYRISGFDLAQSQYLHLAIDKELVAPSGIGLGDSFKSVLVIPPLGQEVRFMQPGSVLALGSNGLLGFQSSGLDAIRWTVNQVLPEYISQVAASGSFGHPSLPLDAYAARFSGDIRLQRGTPGSPQFSTLDLKQFLQEGKGVFMVELVGLSRREDGKYEEVFFANRFVLATDLGLMIKKAADGSRNVFVCSLSDSTPLSRVRLEVLGANGLPVHTTQTDVEGKADIPSLDGLLREKLPTALIAKRGEDLAFLPLRDSSLAINTSRYGMAGYGHDAPALTHVFSQRDLYRPGDTLYFAAIVRDRDFTPFDGRIPLKGVLTDPSGNSVDQPVRLDETGMMTCSWDIPENAYTGSYRFSLRVADGAPASRAIVLGSTEIKVEEFQPDVLSMNVALKDASGNALAPGKGWIRTDRLTGHVRLRNLFGTPAQDRRVVTNVNVHASSPNFGVYNDYMFYMPDVFPGRTSSTLPDTRTNERGEAETAIDLAALGAGDWGRGLARISVDFRGFEPGGGRQVAESASVLYSPLACVIGARPSANLNYIPHNRETFLDFLALDNTLNRMDPGQLTFVVSTQRSVPTLVSDERGYRYRYATVDKEHARETLSFAATDEGPALKWRVPTDVPGDHVLTVLDQDGMYMANIPFTVAGEAIASGDTLSPGVLRIKLDKEDYAPGDVAQVALTTPFDGLGLLTLERDRVHSHVWFRAKAGESVQHLRIPDDFEGRGYLNVSFIRSLRSRDIGIQPHVYTAQPMTVNIARRNMGLKLAAPETVRPGETVTVRVSARDTGKAVVFAVDEGILQLSDFSTPSPLDALLKYRSLNVQTMQAFDLLMPDQRHVRDVISAFGGGGMMRQKSAYLNPFKRKGEPPVTKWSELIDVGPGGTDVAFTVPEYYNGTVRIMVVGSSSESVGSADTTTTVRGPLVATPQFPLMVAPGDEFEAGFGLANSLEQDNGLIALSFDEGDRLQLLGETPDSIMLEPGSEGIIPLRLRALDDPGDASVIMTAKSGEHTVNRTASLSVRPASPRMSRLDTGFTNTSSVIEMGRQLYPYGASVEAAVSSLPLPAVRGLVRYLDAYPYGCTEQRISQAFPYALLLKNPALLAQAGEDEQALHERTINIIRSTGAAIRSRFHVNNGLSLWRYGSGDLLMTAYAADFLMTAREAGLNLDPALERDMIAALRSMLGRQISTIQEARENAYGIWVLSRYGDVTSRFLSTLLRTLQADVPEWNRDVAAPLIAASFKLLRLDKPAGEILEKYDPEETGDTDEMFDALARDSLYITILAKHFPEKLGNMNAQAGNDLLDDVMDALRNNRYATFSASQAVRALLALSEARPVAPVTMRCVDESTEAMPLELGPSIQGIQAPACASFSIDLPEGHPRVYWQIFSDGFDRTIPSGALSQGLEVRREILDEDEQPLSSVNLGDEVLVRLTLRAHGNQINDVAIVSLLPGGFETDADNSALLVSSQISIDSMDRREDRVLFFGSIPTRERTITYKMRAVNKGRFALPPVYVEAMYSQSLRARSESGVIEVK